MIFTHFCTELNCFFSCQLTVNCVCFSCMEHQHQCHHQRRLPGEHSTLQAAQTQSHTSLTYNTHTRSTVWIELMVLCVCVRLMWSWMNFWGPHGRRLGVGQAMRNPTIQSLGHGGPPTSPTSPLKALSSSARSWAQVWHQEVWWGKCISFFSLSIINNTVKQKRAENQFMYVVVNVDACGNTENSGSEKFVVNLIWFL